MRRPLKAFPYLSATSEMLEQDTNGSDQWGKLPNHIGRKKKKQKKPNEKEILENWLRDDTADSFISYDGMISYLSPKEREKLDGKFHTPKTKSQEKYVELLNNKDKKIIVVNGPAGTGKTLFATELGIKHFLLEGYDKMIFTRPSVTVDEDLGYLPGTLDEKMAPWIRPIYDILYDFLSVKEISSLMDEKRIEIVPLGYMRGRTFQNTWIVADEMQNSTVSQMKMLLTRLGENSRLVITGDLDQFDISLERNGLQDFLEKFKGKRSQSISSFEFDRSDIQREEVVREVLEIYSDFQVADTPVLSDDDHFDIIMNPET